MNVLPTVPPIVIAEALAPLYGMPLFQHWIRCSHFFPPKIGSTNSVKFFSLLFNICSLFYFNPSTMSDSSLHLSIFFSSSSSVFCCASDNSCAFVKSDPTFASSSPIDSIFSSSSAIVSSIVSHSRCSLYESLRLRCCFGASSTTFSLFELPLSP